MQDQQVILEPPAETSAKSHNRGQHKFTFDFSYWSHDNKDPHFVGQDRVFKDLGTDVVENAFSGYNACVFAYGQTGSGKTYTMMGNDGDEGLIPRICQTMFEKMQAGKEEGTTYRTEVSNALRLFGLSLFSLFLSCLANFDILNLDLDQTFYFDAYYA